MSGSSEILATVEEALAGESEWSEWKESDSDDVVRTACAFSNDLGNSGRPGVILIGVNKKGEPIGTDASDEAIQRVVNRLKSTKILPNPSFGVQKVDLTGCEILVVSVQPYPVPPVVEVNGVPWVRVGTSTQRATEADRIRLNERRTEGHQPFDIRPHRGSELGALAMRKLQAQHDVALQSDEDEETFPEFEKWLGQKNLARMVDGIWIPTNAAVLVYGVDPLTYLPGAFVEFARYDGIDVDSTVTSRRTITGDLCDQLETIWTQLNANNSMVEAEGQGIRTPYEPEYPVEALKELARNQVQHRLYEGTNAPGRINWFKDRIELYNPGGPYGHARDGEFGDQADYRNPTITNLLVELGYVEHLGRGIRRVRRLLEKNGNPPLEVRTDGFTVITIRSHA